MFFIVLNRSQPGQGTCKNEFLTVRSKRKSNSAFLILTTIASFYFEKWNVMQCDGVVLNLLLKKIPFIPEQPENMTHVAISISTAS